MIFTTSTKKRKETKKKASNSCICFCRSNHLQLDCITHSQFSSVSPIFLITEFSFTSHLSLSFFLSCSAWHLSTRTTLISRHLTRKEENQRKEKKRKHRFVVVQFGREKGNKQTNKNSNFHRTDGWTSGQANETNEKVDVGDALFFFSTSVGKSMA